MLDRRPGGGWRGHGLRRRRCWSRSLRRCRRRRLFRLRFRRCFLSRLVPCPSDRLRRRCGRELDDNRIRPQGRGVVAHRRRRDRLGRRLVAGQRVRGAVGALRGQRKRARRAASLPIGQLDLRAWRLGFELHRLYRRLWLEDIQIDQLRIRRTGCERACAAHDRDDPIHDLIRPPRVGMSPVKTYRIRAVLTRAQ